MRRTLSVGFSFLDSGSSDEAEAGPARDDIVPWASDGAFLFFNWTLLPTEGSALGTSSFVDLALATLVEVRSDGSEDELATAVALLVPEVVDGLATTAPGFTVRCSNTAPGTIPLSNLGLDADNKPFVFGQLFLSH